MAETAEKLNGVQTKANQAAAPEDLEAQFKGVQNEIRRVKGELKKAKVWSYSLLWFRFCY